MMERVINIIGLGISAKDVADTGENWVINIAYKHLIGKKIDKMFFMDDFNIILHKDSIFPPTNYDIISFIKDNPTVEIISKYNDIIKNLEGKKLAEIKEYPLNKAVDLAKGGYFTSSIAYALCYAILEKVDRIRLYGLEIWTGSDANEYNYQRPCLEFWIAFAIGKGIKIEVPYLLMQNISNFQNYYGYLKGDLNQNRR